MSKKGLIVVSFAFLMLISSVMAAPLQIDHREFIKTTVDRTDGGFTYTTNVTGVINITNNGPDDLFDVWILIDLDPTKIVGGTGGLIVKEKISSSEVYIYTDVNSIPSNIRGYLTTTGVDFVVHIPYILSNGYVTLYYDVNDTALGIANGAPIIINETQNPDKVPSHKDINWRVTIQVSPNWTFWGTPVPDINVNLTKYLSNDNANYGSSDWTTLEIVSGSESANSGTVQIWDGPYGPAGNDALNVTGATIGSANNLTVSFNVSAHNAGTFTNTGHAFEFATYGFAVVFINLDRTVTGSSVTDVWAVGPLNLSANKEGPFLNETTGEYTIWKESANITNAASGLIYYVYDVSLYSTNASGFTSGDMTHIPGSDYSENPGLLPSGNTYSTSWHNFTFPGVPIIWANVTFKVIEDQTSGYWVTTKSIHNSSAQYGSSILMVERIYVIGSYIIKVTKKIEWNSDNIYDVDLYVENYGGQESPSIWVYDLVPENFDFYNFDNSTWDGSGGSNYIDKATMWNNKAPIINNPASGYSKGIAINLRGLQGGADGDGFADSTEINNEQAVHIHYQIQGSGDYKIMDVFIVGIDPVFATNRQTAPKVLFVGGARTENYESLFLSLGIIGLIGLVFINRRK